MMIERTPQHYCCGSSQFGFPQVPLFRPQNGSTGRRVNCATIASAGVSFAQKCIGWRVIYARGGSAGVSFAHESDLPIQDRDSGLTDSF